MNIKKKSLRMESEMSSVEPAEPQPHSEMEMRPGCASGRARIPGQGLAELSPQSSLSATERIVGSQEPTRPDTEFCVRWELPPAERLEWESFYARSRHSHINQHLSFAAVEAGKGRRPVYMMARKQGRLVCAGLFSIRPFFGGKRFSLEASCFRGPVFDEVKAFREFALQARAFCRRNFIGALRIAPHWFFPEAEAVVAELRNLGFAPCRSGGSTREPTGLVDVARSDQELLASFSKSARREFYRAERQGISVRVPSGQQEVEHYFGTLNALLRERRCIPMQGGECMALYEHVLKTQDLGILLTAWKSSTFLGGLLMVRSPNMAHGYRFVIVPNALRELSNLRVAPLVWHRGMSWARDQGCHWLDLEGYIPNADREHPVYAIHKYKGEFNPSPVDRLEPHTCAGHPVIYGYYQADRFVRRRVARVPRYLWCQLVRRVQSRNGVR